MLKHATRSRPRTIMAETQIDTEKCPVIAVERLLAEACAMENQAKLSSATWQRASARRTSLEDFICSATASSRRGAALQAALALTDVVVALESDGPDYLFQPDIMRRLVAALSNVVRYLVNEVEADGGDLADFRRLVSLRRAAGSDVGYYGLDPEREVEIPDFSTKRDADSAATDPHCAWWAEVQDLETENNALLERAKDREAAPVGQRLRELLRLLGTTPAKTLDGAWAQADCLARYYTENSNWVDHPDQTLARTLASSLVAMSHRQ